jgi:uncharacterized membrane protein YecN with MAPEG domain
MHSVHLPVHSPLPVSLGFAGALGLFNLWLAYRCVRLRLKGPGGVGDLGIPLLKARMRAHANFTEYTPAVLTLMVLLEFSGGSATWLQAYGGIYLVGRLLHAFGIERPKFTMQFLGALSTWLVLLALSAWAVWLIGANLLAVRPA